MNAERRRREIALYRSILNSRFILILSRQEIERLIGERRRAFEEQVGQLYCTNSQSFFNRLSGIFKKCSFMLSARRLKNRSGLNCSNYEIVAFSLFLKSALVCCAKMLILKITCLRWVCAGLISLKNHAIMTDVSLSPFFDSYEFRFH